MKRIKIFLPSSWSETAASFLPGRGMLCLSLLLTVSSIFTVDGVIREQHCVVSKPHESDCMYRKYAYLAASQAAAIRCSFTTMLVAGEWFTNIMIQSFYSPDEGKGPVWWLHVRGAQCGWDAMLWNMDSEGEGWCEKVSFPWWFISSTPSRLFFCHYFLR